MRDVTKRKEAFRKSVIGERHVNNQGYSFTIIEYYNKLNCTIQFDDGGILHNVNRDSLKTSSINNPNHPYLCGIGYIGIGLYSTKVNGKTTTTYTRWANMIRRCYNKEYQEKYPSYKNVTVCDEWHNFQNFAQWFEKNYNPEYMEDWHVDKDILIKGNKIYSPETCCFVPREVNNLFRTMCGKICIGTTFNKITNKFIAQVYMKGKKVCLGYFLKEEDAFQDYKIAKEAYIKEVADKWKGLISEQVYQAMYDYKIEKNE